MDQVTLAPLRIALLWFIAAASVLAADPVRFRITLDPKVANHTISGRLLVFLTSKKPTRERLQTSFIPGETWVASLEVDALRPGGTITLDPDQNAFPAPFSTAPAGEYWVMALLDPDHTYAYHGEDGGDFYGPIVHTKSLAPADAGTLELTLDKTIEARFPADTESVKLAEFESPALSAFFGRPIRMHAGVVLPPSFDQDPTRTYPTAYVIHGFGGDHRGAWFQSQQYLKAMKSGELSEIAYVFLDASCSTGHHVFADSANNGPWGRALTTEFIPYLEKQFRLIAKPGARFLTGHSSGGWSTLWLQVAYPDFFGGTWSTSPDPVDFRNFTGVNATPGSTQNFYLTVDGKPLNLIRMKGKDIATVREFVRQEETVGEYGGQIASFEWVFSPRGTDGRPMKLFNRTTGELNPEVERAWEKYDIRLILERNWPVLGPKLKGKIHLLVGDQDNFHLEEAALMLCDFLKSKGEDVCEVIPGRDHMDLYQEYKTYPKGLRRRIDEEMRNSATLVRPPAN